MSDTEKNSFVSAEGFVNHEPDLSKRFFVFVSINIVRQS